MNNSKSKALFIVHFKKTQKKFRKFLWRLGSTGHLLGTQRNFKRNFGNIGKYEEIWETLQYLMEKFSVSETILYQFFLYSRGNF